MKKLEASGKIYNLYWINGIVVNQGKYATTHVSGSGGGSGQYQAPVNISSSTTVHNDIFLTDNSGKEHSIQLSGFDVACREGNELSVIWAIKEGLNTGPYIAVLNHTTSQYYENKTALAGMFRPEGTTRKAMKYSVIGLIALYFILSFIIGEAYAPIVVGALLWLVAIPGVIFIYYASKAKGIKRANEQFTQTIKFEDYR